MSALSPLLQEGIVHHRNGDLAAATTCYQRAREMAPDSADVSYLLAEVAFLRGDYGEAEALAREALALSPRHPNALLCLGQIQIALDCPEEAACTLQMLVRFAPDWPAAWEKLGMASQLCGLFEDAKEAYCRFVELDPGNAIAWDRLASLYLDSRQARQAATVLEQALGILPDHPELSRHLGDAYRQVGDTETARKVYRGISCRRKDGALAITEAITLPAFYRSCDHVQEARQAMAARLAELEDEDFAPCPDPVTAGGKNNFYSVYQGFDDRPLQEQLARLWRRIYTPARPIPPARPAERQRLKVGFVSAHFRRHTIGDLFSGLIAGLPQEEFETVVYHLGDQRDDLSDWLASRAGSFRMPRSNDLRQLADLIAAEACDVLIYPDIGMEPLTYFLAFNRLAPVQAVSWGHPLTTGLDTIDYYISGHLQEPKDGQRYYTEKLLRQPVIPAHLFWHPPPEGNSQALRQSLGVPAGGRLFGIVQSLFKFHPGFDPVIAELLATDPKTHLVLVADRENRLAPALQKRLAPILGDRQQALHIVPHQGFDEYRRLLASLDACIDTQPFGGGKTAFDAAIIGTPVACVGGIRLAGKSAEAICRQFDLDWPFAANQAELVAATQKSPLQRQALDRAVIEEANRRAIMAWAETIRTMAGE